MRRVVIDMQNALFADAVAEQSDLFAADVTVFFIK